MKIQVLMDADSVAKAAANFIAAERAAVAARGHFIVALSGGRTPVAMLRNTWLAKIFPGRPCSSCMVDERIASADV